MKVIDFMNDLHEECRSPFIKFFMDGDMGVYLLMANEYHGCHKDEYIVDYFNSPERAWDAFQQLQKSLKALPAESEKFALRWDDEMKTFDWEFLQHVSE